MTQTSHLIKVAAVLGSLIQLTSRFAAWSLQSFSVQTLSKDTIHSQIVRVSSFPGTELTLNLIAAFVSVRFGVISCHEKDWPWVEISVTAI